MSLRVSVVITSFNHDLFLDHCIESAINQSYKNTELLIVDDCSTDNSVDTIKKYQGHFSKILLLKENHGACVALNKILKFCTGEYVAILNSDDYWFPQKLEEQVGFLKKNDNFHAVFTSCKVVNEKNHYINQDLSPFNFINRNRFEWLKFFFEKGNCLCHSSVLIRRSVFLEIGGYDERLRSLPDYEFWVRFSEKFNFYILDSTLVSYRICADRVSESTKTIENYNRALFETELILGHYLKLRGIKDNLSKIFDLAGDENEQLLAFGRLALNHELFSHRNFGLKIFYRIIPGFGNKTSDNIELIQDLQKFLGNSHTFTGLASDYKTFFDEQLEFLAKQEIHGENRKYDEVDSLTKELALKNDKITRMQSSFSWKITSPLRFLRRKFTKSILPSYKLISLPKYYPKFVESQRIQISEFEFIPHDYRAEVLIYDRSSMKLNWLIPDFYIGSGGHTTIFRMIYHLEKMGHKSKIWICKSTHFKSLRIARNTIRGHFFPLKAELGILTSPLPSEMEGDCIISTSYETCYYSRAICSNKPRFYFVQDFEPFFSAVGTNFFLALETYKFGFHCITAGKWLASRISEENAKVEGFFDLAVDHSIFHPTTSQLPNSLPKLVVYSRSVTERRVSEMVIHGLNILFRRGARFEVLFFGSKQIPIIPEFSYSVLGILKPRALASLYRSSNLGLVFSATNYSLVPLEMMACRLPVIEFDGKNTRNTYPKDTVEFAAPNPHKIADKIEFLLSDSKRQNLIKDEAEKYVKNLKWVKSGKKLESLLGKVLDRYSKL